MLSNILWIVGAYLYGALPVVYLIGRLRGVDLSKEEDMHISLWRKVGRIEGFLGVFWDVVKGAIAVLVVDRGFHLVDWAVAGTGVAVILGEMWSVFLKFRGEKSNTTGMGMAAALVYKAIPFLLVPIVIGAAIRTIPRFFRRGQTMDERMKLGGPPSLSLPLGMLFGFALFPLGCWVMDAGWWRTGAGIVLFVLIVIKRLTDGLTEDMNREGFKARILVNRILFDRSHL
ncbi:MAG: glycerol-3-phosphate acyltransferase [Dehalococcoidia bacterium]|nr:glycerol-3-phosphate acyltransferase [Dehalococcoidia bacterium]